MNNYQEIEEDEIDLKELWNTLKSYKWSIFFITLLIGTLTAFYAYFLQPTYTSSTILSFEDQKKSSLVSMLPEGFSGLGIKESELESIALTVKTRKFINEAVKDLKLSQHYFIEKNYKKVEVYNFEHLKISLEIKDKAYTKMLFDYIPRESKLFGKVFEITPIDEKSFNLKIQDVKFEKKFNYGESIHEELFSLTVFKVGELKEKYYVSADNKDELADNILENLTTTVLSDKIMKISYINSVPLRAKEIVDVIGKHLIQYMLEKKTSELGQTLSFLDEQLIDIKKHLKGEGEKLKNYQQKSELYLPMESSIALFSEVNKKEELLKTLELQLGEVQKFQNAIYEDKLNTVSLLNTGVNISSIQSLIEAFRANSLELNEMQLQAENREKAIIKNREFSLLIQELHEERLRFDKLNFNFMEDHPQVLESKNKIMQLERNIAGYIDTHMQNLLQNREIVKRKLLDNITTTEHSLQLKIEDLKATLIKKHTMLQSIPEKDLNTQELKRKFLLSEKIYTFLLEKKMDISISRASTIANTRIIEDPREALEPTKPNKKLIVIVGVVIGFILAIFLAFIRAMGNTSVRDAATVEKLTDAPLYGVLPIQKNRRFFEESLRAIRTNIAFILPKDKKCVKMLISSTVQGEGKTTIIAGLAKVIAKTGKKVLIMDLDLRKPRLYQELEMSNKIGMTHYLINNLEFSSVIQNVSENLDFFAAGAVPPNPSELLMSEVFHETIDSLMDEYDVILFDTPPIGSVIDANMLLEHSDIVLLVVNARKAEKSFIEGFNKLRKDRKIKSAGIILNQVKLGKSDSYGYGYGYGYNYGDGK